MSAQTVNWEEALVEDLAQFTHDPERFVRYAWRDEPRPWQRTILSTLRDHLQSPKTKHQPCRIAVASGHGIGKSALVGMVIGWALSTCEDTRIVVTASTGDQLSTKTVPEVSKWFRQMINAHWWEVRATSIRVKQAEHSHSWRCDFLTWSKENTEAFAGLHNQGKRIVLIFDEASAIDESVWETAEGALTDSGTEIIWLAFGNPVRNTGRFRQCFGDLKHRWHTHQIDSRTVEQATNKEEIQRWIEDYGEDSDFVRVRVRGEFPRAGSNQFIGSDLVEACRKFKAEGYEALPKVLAMDVARFGDDQTVIMARQGRKVRLLKRVRNFDTVQSANLLIEQLKAERADAVVVDADGIGAGVVDYVRALGHKVFEFHGGQQAFHSPTYFNRRAEVWGLMRDALKGPMEIPDDAELAADLTSPEYGFSNKQQIMLEKKEDMKERGLGSPDSGDALAMTFAVNAAPQKTADDTPQGIYGGQLAQGWMR